MTPKHQNRRIGMIVVLAVFALTGLIVLLNVLGENKEYFKNPRDVVAVNFVQPEQAIRIGGIVVDGSIEQGDGLVTQFSVVDFENADSEIPPLRIVYEGVLPDLFAEGQGVVVTGRLNDQGVFVASRLLAKHDENYKPKMPDYD